jgi:hypothetical protein
MSPVVANGNILQTMLRGRDLTPPVILASGATPMEALRGPPELKINAILLKPYLMEELLAVVKEVLHADGA